MLNVITGHVMLILGYENGQHKSKIATFCTTQQVGHRTVPFWLGCAAID
jgi:hypothetical protein